MATARWALPTAVDPDKVNHPSGYEADVLLTSRESFKLAFSFEVNPSPGIVNESILILSCRSFGIIPSPNPISEGLSRTIFERGVAFNLDLMYESNELNSWEVAITVGNSALNRWFNICCNFSSAHGVGYALPKSSRINNGVLRTLSNISL